MPATWIETTELPLDQLERLPGNPRRGNISEIRKSLIRNGQYRAVVVRRHDGHHTVLAGNHTTDALRALAAGPPSVEELLEAWPAGKREAHEPAARAFRAQLERATARCEVIECGDDDAVRIAAADNRLSDLAVDDPEDLVAFLEALDDDLDGTGWATEDLELLVAGPPDLDDLKDKFGDPEAGDLWPILRFKVPPNIRDDFYDLTEGCETPDDDNARFIYLVNRLRALG